MFSGRRSGTLQQHKKLALPCEEGILRPKVKSFLLILQEFKTIMPQTTTNKPSM
jgi:hypothetical protein